MVDRYVRRARRWIWSRTYALGPGRFYRPTYERIAEAITPQSGKMLDVGTGPGWLCIAAARQRPGLQVFGIDTSPDMVSASLRNREGVANCTFSEMNAAEMKYANDTFDVVTAMQTAHHWADPAAASGGRKRPVCAARRNARRAGAQAPPGGSVKRSPAPGHRAPPRRLGGGR